MLPEVRGRCVHGYRRRRLVRSLPSMRLHGRQETDKRKRIEPGGWQAVAHRQAQPEIKTSRHKIRRSDDFRGDDLPPF